MYSNFQYSTVTGKKKGKAPNVLKKELAEQIC